MMKLLESVNHRSGAAQAGCYICGTNRGGLIDFDVTIVGEGRLVICRKHVLQAARELGFIKPEEADQLRSTAKDALLRVSELKQMIQTQNATIHALQNQIALTPVEEPKTDAVQEELAKLRKAKT